MAAFNEAERLRMVHRFQHEHDVSRLRVDGLKVWPIVILQLAKLTHKNLGIRSALDVAKLALREALSFGRMTYDKHRDRANSSPMRQSCDALFLTNPTRRARIEDTYYDRICDPFVDALRRVGLRCSVLEWSFDHEYRVPRHNPSALIQGGIDWVVLKNLLSGRRPRLEFGLLDSGAFRALLDYHQVSPSVFARDLVRSARFTLALRDYFMGNLDETGASLAFFFPYYGAVSFGFNLACRALGIRTVEVQHGYYGDTMLLYTGFRNVDCAYDLLPDAIWGWEERDRDAVRAWGDDESLLPRVHVGGNLWNNLWKFPGVNDNRYLSRYTGLSLRPGDRRVVLLTLPPVFDIPSWLPDTIRATAGTMRWHVRYHHHMKHAAAAQYRAAFRNLGNVEFELANRLPLPVLLSHCDVHVTVNSSSVVEAREFNRKSVIISETGARIFAALIEEGWACSALTGDELRVALGRFLAEPRPTAARTPARSNSELVRDFTAGLTQ